jgi:CBS-domain-containing membrane protein
MEIGVTKANIAVECKQTQQKEPLSTLDLTDQDVLDAMREISGYLDISTADFRQIYGLAKSHALARMFDNVRAGDLMIPQIEPLLPEMRIGAAARQLVRQSVKSLPVVDSDRRVVGILTESDFLHCLGTDSYLKLILNLSEATTTISRRCSDTTVADTMSAPAVTVHELGTVNQILDCFARHDGRSMPVVDAQGRLRGLLLRKSFLQACRFVPWEARQ